MNLLGLSVYTRCTPQPTSCLFFVLLALTLVTPERLSAQGGPPLLTDDPGTPGPGRWEIIWRSGFCPKIACTSKSGTRSLS